MYLDLKQLRDIVYQDYEFWLGCYETDKENWKSGLIHGYRNVIADIDKRLGNPTEIKCPCHICTKLLHIRRFSDRK